MEIGNKRIIPIQTQRNIFTFCSLYHIYASDVKSAHTQYTHTLNVSFRDVKSFGWREKGRRDWEGME